MKTLFTNVTAVTMDPASPVLKDAFVAVEGMKIASVGTQRPAGDFDRVVDCTGRVMMPGLINAHTHIPMVLMRGYGGGCDLHTWLNEYIFPAESRWDDRSIAAATQLGLAEMISSGVTCIADMYMRTGVIAQEVVKAGISANLSCGVVYFGAPEDFSPEKCGDCQVTEELRKSWHGAEDGQILIDASIHAEYTSCPPLWKWVADYGQRFDLGMHVHISETRSEHEKCLEKYGKTPIALFDQYGVWEQGGQAAHCVWVSDEDMEIMARKGITAIHNPYSNLKLGSGVARVPVLSRAGVNIALGCDPMAVTAPQALAMATVNGAKALRRNTGVIAPGKMADLILVDFTAPNLIPCHDPAENLVFSAYGSNVVMNMARGKIIYENGTFLTLGLEKIRAEVKDYALPKIFG